jgi:xanthine dehydrogenase accessory factor
MTETQAIIEASRRAAERNVRSALATVVRVEGSAYRRPGARMFVTETGERTGVLSGGCLEGDVAERALQVIETGRSVVVTYDTTSDDDIVWGLGIGCRGVVQVLIEPAVDLRLDVEPPVPLVICGAGDDALPLVALAQNLGWHTTVVDTRSRAATIERFAQADEVVLCRAEEVSNRLRLTEKSVVVTMTHNYLHDLELLRTLLQTPLRYLGCLGPRQRTEKLLTDLADEVSGIYLGQLYAPAGLDIGAETPMEVAFSIVAEINAVLSGREGGLLRKRKGPIHTPTPHDEASSFEATQSVAFQCEVAIA